MCWFQGLVGDFWKATRARHGLAFAAGRLRMQGPPGLLPQVLRVPATERGALGMRKTPPEDGQLQWLGSGSSPAPAVHEP
uniref:Uncharacterized protein n=1 Tax=Tetraselmis sp. GSL018 TaxID=582737 RepID=A0A061RXL7_9CHLO